MRNISDTPDTTYELFRPEAVSTETREINDRLAAMLAALPEPVDLDAARDAYVHGRNGLPIAPRSPRARTTTIPGPGGDIALRLLVPEDVQGVYFYIHGGAYIFGANDTWDAELERIGRDTGLASVSLDYRLAPENPFPAALKDSLAAALWLIDRAESLFGTSWLAIGGESAGTHLAAATLLRLRDSGHANAFRAANLMYGIYDLSLTPSARHATGTAFIDHDGLDQIVTTFLPGGNRQDPAVSPLYADLTQLPPALFSVGTLDPLLDDSLFMHARWQAAGNPADLAIYPGGVHGFDHFPGELAQSANDRVIQFLRTRREATQTTGASA